MEEVTRVPPAAYCNDCAEFELLIKMKPDREGLPSRPPFKFVPVARLPMALLTADQSTEKALPYGALALFTFMLNCSDHGSVSDSGVFHYATPVL